MGRRESRAERAMASIYLQQLQHAAAVPPIRHSGARSVCAMSVWRRKDGPARQSRARGCLALKEWARPGMLSSTTGVFREPEDFQVAMREYGCTNLVATDQGAFRTRLTRIELHRLRLLSAEEALARIAFFSIPRDAILVSVPLGDGLSPMWGGTAARIGDIVTLGGGQRMYTRSVSGCSWGVIVFPIKLLESCARAVVGGPLAFVPGVSRRRPSAKACRDLVRLHVSATRVADARAGVITMSEP